MRLLEKFSVPAVAGIGVVTAALVGVGFVQFRALQDLRTRILVQNSFEKVRQDVRGLILSNTAWEKSLAQPSNKGLMALRWTFLDLYNAEGQPAFVTSDPNNGFTAQGKPCSKLGKGDCVLKLKLTAERICTDAACLRPATLVTSQFAAAANFGLEMDFKPFEFQTVRPFLERAGAEKQFGVRCMNEGEFWAGVDPSTGRAVCRRLPLLLNLKGYCTAERPECNCNRGGFQARYPAVCVGERWACNCDLFWLKRMGFL